jgi:hypothetical protein
MSTEWRATPRLRWVDRPCGSAADDNAVMRVLEQWWGPDLPGYMRDDSVGEWRDVPVVGGVP